MIYNSYFGLHNFNAMRRIHLSSQVMLLLAVGALAINSCKKEDEPFIKPKVSFSKTELILNEAGETATIEVVLDKEYTDDILIEYKLSGIAVDKVTAIGAKTFYDYEITSDYLQVEIRKGKTSGVIELKLYSDFVLEKSETFKITLDKVNSENIEIASNNEITVTLEQEDGLFVALGWGTQPGDVYLDVDMDLFLWAKDGAGNYFLTNIFSARASTLSPESLFLPSVIPDGEYGLSCNYYSGSKSPMNFRVSFVEILDGEEATTTDIDGVYTSVNVNNYDVTTIKPILVQTFSKVDGYFGNYSEIDVPTSKSRMITGTLPTTVIRGKVNLPVIEGKKN